MTRTTDLYNLVADYLLQTRSKYYEIPDNGSDRYNLVETWVNEMSQFDFLMLLSNVIGDINEPIENEDQHD